MDQRKLRKNIFSLLFEYELMKDFEVTQKRIEELVSKYNITGSKEIFLKNYINSIISNENFLIENINSKLKTWSYETLGTSEKIILKMAFFEILVENVGYQIAINEAIELSKEYGDEKTKDFVNGVLAELVK